MKEKPEDRVFMERCLDLALKGIGSTAPNPMVGCVIVHGGKIIGEGFHRNYGGAHAEVNAVAMVRDKELLGRSTLYVNLEPCAHFGKTPPCTTLIMDHSIPRVVVGGLDPNVLVEGKGIRLLEENGVEVIQGIMEKECRELNSRFYTFHEENRPYVILKWAQTRDGFIDRIRTPGDPPEINWITDENARQLVHKWRSEEQAILVGTGTAAADDPGLTVRDWHGRNPLRLVLDLKGRLPGKLRLFNGETPTLVFTRDPESNRKNRKNLEYVRIPENTDTIEFILDYLHQINIVSLMVEGGTKLLTSFINSGVWDEARVFSTEQDFGEGVRAPQLTANPVRKVRISNSLLQFYHR